MQNLEEIKKIHREICESQDRLNKLMSEVVNLGANIHIDVHELTDQSIGYSPFSYKSINVLLSIRLLRP